MSHLAGKGMYIWKIKNCEGGQSSIAAAMAYDAGLTHVLIKILDGPWAYNQRPYYSPNGELLYADDILGPFVQAFKAQGLKVYGWQWVYFDNPIGEAKAAITRVQKFNLDGFIVNAESPAKNKVAQTRQYLALIEDIGVPTGLSSYRYPSLHNEIDWAGFFKGVDTMFPQVYWMQASNPAEQLQKSLDEYTRRATSYGVALDYFPTGSAFSEGGWTATPAQVTEFMNKAKALNLQGVNFWEWSAARSIPGMWEAIASFAWGGAIPPESEISVDKFVIEKVYPGMVNFWGYDGPKPVDENGLEFKMES